MKKAWIIISMTVLCMAGVVHAQTVGLSRLGLHGSYSLGGDVEDSEFGFGGQVEMSVTPNVFVELAVSHFSDEPVRTRPAVRETMELDLTTIGLSAILRGPLTDWIQGYVSAGVNYNIPDTDTRVAPTQEIWTPHTVEIDLDNRFGYHIAAGLNYPVHENWELFVEYRYTFLKLKGDWTATIPHTLDGVSWEHVDVVSYKEDYNFGLVKLGVNYRF